MAVKEKQWYEATNLFNDEVWHNYFFEVDSIVKYISVEPDFKNASYIEENMDDFEGNILDNYELEETIIDKTSFQKVVKELENEYKDNTRKIIKGFLG